MSDGFPKCTPMYCMDRTRCADVRRKAIEDGQALLKRMKGRGWRLVVHENLGWHYKVTAGPLAVIPSRSTDGTIRYFTLLSDDPAGVIGGAAFWTEGKRSFLDPNLAVRRQLLVATAVVDRLEDVLKKVRQVVTP